MAFDNPTLVAIIAKNPDLAARVLSLLGYRAMGQDDIGMSFRLSELLRASGVPAYVLNAEVPIGYPISINTPTAIRAALMGPNTGGGDYSMLSLEAAAVAGQQLDLGSASGVGTGMKWGIVLLAAVALGIVIFASRGSS